MVLGVLFAELNQLGKSVLVKKTDTTTRFNLRNSFFFGEKDHSDSVYKQIVFFDVFHNTIIGKPENFCSRLPH